MKNILLPGLFLLLGLTNMYSQIVKYPCDDTVAVEIHDNLALGKLSNQSSNFFGDGGFASMAVDGYIDQKEGSYSKTNVENQPWWEVDLGQSSFIRGVKVWYPGSLFTAGLSGYYILMSDQPFGGNNLNEIISAPGVTHIYVENPVESGQEVAAGYTQARYVRIQFEGTGTAAFLEVQIPGGPGGDDEGEICNNGIDDDCDHRIDCEDPDCAPTIWWVNKKDPTCPVCNDGWIEIKAYGDNLQYSIDGGNTFSGCVPVNQSDWCGFNNLDEGDYNIAVTNGTCTSYWRHNPVKLRAPVGDPTLSDCDNGDFELGSFQFWDQTTGLHISNQVYQQTSPPLLGGQFQIFPSSGAGDPIVGNDLPMQAPSGTYFARIGSLTAENDGLGDDGVGASLQYRFVVDPTTALNYFWFAMVLVNGHDEIEINPFFEWKVMDAQTMQVLGNLTGHYAADLNNPYFKTIEGNNTNFTYRGWTCVSIDMTAYIGQEVILEFIATDCQPGAHLGYAYVDAFCTEPIPPSATLVINDVYCLNQQIDIEITDERLFNQYNWEITLLDIEGNPVNTATLPTQIDYHVPDLIDVVAIYKSYYPGYTVHCGDKFQITLNLSNDCISSKVEHKIEFACNSYDVEYLDIIHCSQNDDVQIIGGIQNCPGCTFEWTPAQYLNNSHIQNPTIRGSVNELALKQTYKVKITTPEGCVYEDEVKIIEGSEILGNIKFNIVNVSYCEAELQAMVHLMFPVDGATLITSFNVDGTVLPGILISPPGISTDHVFKFPNKISRRHTVIPHSFHFSLNSVIVPPGNFNIVGNCGINQYMQWNAPDPQYFGDINAYLPNIFSPNGDGVDDLWFPGFSPNVSKAWLWVFDRWGGLVYAASATAPIDGPPLTGMELSWNGHWNNDINAPLANSGDTCFTIVVGYENCDNPSPGCASCSNWQIATGGCDTCHYSAECVGFGN
ncbi:MAG: gliding motility-associated C-terminal domain-containing protein [Lewinellaceae bacterium]|nr:gliding motility-associated C-terminal domain-containing protein [Lewinellaceae bacterium]